MYYSYNGIVMASPKLISETVKRLLFYNDWADFAGYSVFTKTIFACVELTGGIHEALESTIRPK